MMTLQLRPLLERAFGTVKDAGEWYRVPCPTCQAKDRKKFKRYVNKRFRTSHCFICDRKLVLSELLGMDKSVDISRPDDAPAGPAKENTHPYAKKMPCSKSIPINQLPPDHLAVKFLAKDHLHELDRYYNKHGIVYVPADGGVRIYDQPFISSAERIVFPVVFGGKLVGWQMRAIPGTVYGDHPKCIKYCQLFSKGEYLYNYDNAREYDTVVLVEGIKKALKFDNAVASLGKGLTRTQLNLLHGWKNVVVLLDGDPATQEKAREFTGIIRMNGRNAINVNPADFGFPSPDEATKEQCEDMVCTSIERNMSCLSMT